MCILIFQNFVIAPYISQFIACVLLEKYSNVAGTVLYGCKQCGLIFGAIKQKIFYAISSVKCILLGQTDVNPKLIKCQYLVE